MMQSILKSFKFVLLIFPLFLLSATAIADKKANPLRAFTSDGCSFSPDGSTRQPHLLYNCCVEHDVYYWLGGTYKERHEADLIFHQCVLDKTQDPVVANLYYYIVRAGGKPSSTFPWRWSYGWQKSRGYQEVTTEERVQAYELLPSELKILILK